LSDAALALRHVPMFGWLTIRICEHGIEHLDPDGIDRLRSLGVRVEGEDGCECRCCGGPR
jgi:hypothetical protein